MSRQNVALALAFGLTVSVFLMPGLFRDQVEAESRSAQTERLFASAANFIIHDDDTARLAELRCLALNIYWEARSESIPGQLAVAAVTLNRVESPRFPASVCDVVRQGGEVRRHRCQFSWWCDGKKDDPLDMNAWRRATTLARLASSGVIDDPTRGALWYHADYVTPHWAGAKEKVAKIGRHIFYTLPQDAGFQVSDNLVRIDMRVITR
ncbi:cell wall hydrolase [Thalassospiraceae bacterium LMO-JJ14]|nr:cell wall hydrolase [Thalassospiraceae bacterium LMO-JJ14]